MRTSQCLFNSATALRKVFISNAAALETPGQLQRLLLPSITAPVQRSFSSPSTRPFSTHPAAQIRFNRARPGPGDGNPAPAKNDRTMRDYDIVFPWIQVRQDDGSLTEPQRTSAVLKKLNLDRHSLVLLAAPRTDSESKGPEYPICRIGDRKAELAAQAEKDALKKKTPKIVSKELELNWAIAPHDLRTRMTQLKRFLSKGYQVRVTMMNLKKRAKRRASADEAKETLRVVEEAVAEIPGAKETKAREGEVGDTLVMLLHAPTGSPASASAGADATEALAGTGPGAEKPQASEG
jgi:translation initiation factor IF-3